MKFIAIINDTVIVFWGTVNIVKYVILHPRYTTYGGK